MQLEQHKVFMQLVPAGQAEPTIDIAAVGIGGRLRDSAILMASTMFQRATDPTDPAGSRRLRETAGRIR